MTESSFIALSITPLFFSFACCVAVFCCLIVELWAASALLYSNTAATFVQQFIVVDVVYVKISLLALIAFLTAIVSTIYSTVAKLSFAHVCITSQSLAWFIFTAMLFCATMLIAVLRDSNVTRATLKTLVFYYLIYILASLLWITKDFLTIILLVDAINLCLYTLFFSNNNTCNGELLISGISTLFWVAFLATVFFFVFVATFFYSFFTFDAAIALLINSLQAKVYYTTVSKIFLAFAFIMFFCLKLGLAPFFYWKVNLLRAVSFEAACFYVIFYFSIMFLFFVKVLLMCFVGFTFFASVLYCFIIVAVISLIMFSAATTSIAKFFAFSSAINGAIVLLVCAAAIYNY